ncbi:MAG: hypothetical protein JXR39_11745, partial [Marinilabiliaceae bacterium]|nr:hypothetical protein [Marinilabiliaceae bacterium]
NNIPPELLEEAHIKEAVHILESGSYSKAQLEHYDQYWDSIRSERSLFIDAEERGRVEGEHTGFVKGEQIGMQKGLRKGVYLSALKLMENGMSPTDVARMLAITPEEMKHLTTLRHRFGDNAHLHLDDAE